MFAYKVLIKDARGRVFAEWIHDLVPRNHSAKVLLDLFVLLLKELSF